MYKREKRGTLRKTYLAEYVTSKDPDKHTHSKVHVVGFKQYTEHQKKLPQLNDSFLLINSLRFQNFCYHNVVFLF